MFLLDVYALINHLSPLAAYMVAITSPPPAFVTV